MQVLVESDCRGLPFGCFDGAGNRVAAQQHAGSTGEGGSLDGGTLGNACDLSYATEDSNLRAAW